MTNRVVSSWLWDVQPILWEALQMGRHQRIPVLLGHQELPEHQVPLEHQELPGHLKLEQLEFQEMEQEELKGQAEEVVEHQLQELREVEVHYLL